MEPNVHAGMGEGNPAVPALDKNILVAQEYSEWEKWSSTVKSQQLVIQH